MVLPGNDAVTQQEHEAVHSLNKTANLRKYLLHERECFLKRKPVLSQSRHSPQIMNYYGLETLNEEQKSTV